MQRNSVAPFYDEGAPWRANDFDTTKKSAYALTYRYHTGPDDENGTTARYQRESRWIEHGSREEAFGRPCMRGWRSDKSRTEILPRKKKEKENLGPRHGLLDGGKKTRR